MNLGDLILAYLTLLSSPSFAREILIRPVCVYCPVVWWLSFHCLWRAHGCGANTYTCSASLFSLKYQGISAESSNTGVCSFTGPLEGRAGVMYREWDEKEVTLMHRSTHEARSRILKSVLIKSTITSPFSVFISSSAKSDPLILAFHFCNAKQN